MLASDLVPNQPSTSSKDKITNSLKSFAIYGLFGYQNIILPLDRKVLILITENGSGKTTVLNSLYYTLTQNFEKLEKIDFHKIEINFTSQNLSINSAKLKKTDVLPFILSITAQTTTNPNKLKSWLQKLRKEKQHPLIDEKLSEDKEVTNASNRCNEFQAIINNNLTLKLLFFPTYRRIEEDLSSLGYDDIKLKNSQDKLNNQDKLIQFGMEDVDEKFKTIQSEIKNTAFQLFSQVTGEMLTQFIEGVSVTPEMRNSIKPNKLLSI